MNHVGHRTSNSHFVKHVGNYIFNFIMPQWQQKIKKRIQLIPSQMKKKHLQSTQIVNIHQENLGLTHTQETVNFGKS